MPTDRDTSSSGSCPATPPPKSSQRWLKETIAALYRAGTDATHRRHSSKWPTTKELQNLLTRRVRRDMRKDRFVLSPAPTSSGKSFNGATTAWKDTEAADDMPVVHLHGTKTAREDAVKKSEKAGVDYRALLGGEEACQTRAGDHDDEVRTPTGDPASQWFHDQVVNRANTMSQAHAHLAEYNDGELPCSPCPSVTQWEGVPYDKDGEPAFDVIHATHNFAYVPSLIHQVNVFFDEQPDFKQSIGDRPNDDMTRSRFQDIITAWLKKINAPVHSWEMFAVFAADGIDGLGDLIRDPPDVDLNWFIQGENAHALAPALTEAAFDAFSTDPDRNGRRVGRATSNIARFDASDQEDFRYSRTRITLIMDEDNRPRVFWNVPEMGNAQSIICLDAWPSIQEWKQNVGENLTFSPLVTREEFTNWRRFERGLEVVQIGTAVRPASTDFAVDNYTDEVKQKIVIDSLRAKYGEDFRSALYPGALDDRMSELLPDGTKTITYGNEKSNNSFSGERVGLVTNCLDPGDDYVLNLLAARGLDAVPETFDCIDCPGDNCPICGGDPDRKQGRGFEGPDAGAAENILAGVRDNTLAQAIGRYSRNESDPRALVFVRSSAAPPEMVDLIIPPAWKFTNKQRAIVDYARRNPGTSQKEIVDALGDVSKETVRTTLTRLVECEKATRISGAGDEGADLFLLDGEVPDEGLLDLSML